MLREIWIPVRCGDGKLFGDGGAEYPCVRRYRHRRLLTFLWLEGFKATHESMLSESDAIMWVPRLQDMVRRDQWQDAKLYLSRFLKGATSVEAIVLTRVFHFFTTLANIVVGGGADIVGGGGEEEVVSKKYLDHKPTICHAQKRLRSVILYAQQSRASIDWDRVKERAAEILDELAFATPELKDLTFMPRGSMMPHDVLPISFGFRRRCRPKKQTRPPRSPAGIAKTYLVRRRRLPASSDPSQELTYDQRLTWIQALDRMADILDECLKAGTLEVHPLQTTETEGTVAAPVLQTSSSGLTCPAIYTGIPSVANAGKLASHVPPTDAPLVQPVFNNLTSDCGNSGVRLMANAGPSENGPRKIRRLDTPTVNLRDINSYIEDVSSSVDDLCLITNPHNKANVERRILSTLGMIKDCVALLDAQTAASTTAGVIPQFESNEVTDVTGVGVSVSQAANTPLVPEIPNNIPVCDPTENITDVNDSHRKMMRHIIEPSV